MHVFELTLAGFNGSSSKTDHLIVWVSVQAGRAEFVQQLCSAGLYPTKVTAVELLPDYFEVELQISGDLGELTRFIDERLGTVQFDSPIGKAIDALQLACQNSDDPNFRVYKEALTAIVDTRRHILLLEKRLSDQEISPGGDEYSELLGLVGLYMSPSARLVRLAADARILGLAPNSRDEARNRVAPNEEHVDDSGSDAGTVEKISDVPLDAKGAGAVIPSQGGDNSEASEQSSANGKGPLVRDRVDMAIWSELAPTVAGLEEDSVVGRAVVDLLTQFETLIKAQVKMESYNVEQLKEIGVDQCHVWFYG